MNNNGFDQMKNRSLFDKLGIGSFMDVLHLLILLSGLVWIVANFIIKPLTQDPTYDNSKYSNLREYNFPTKYDCMNELDKMTFYEVETKGTDEGSLKWYCYLASTSGDKEIWKASKVDD